jgi:hypothetical protein
MVVLHALEVYERDKRGIGDDTMGNMCCRVWGLGRDLTELCWNLEEVRGGCEERKFITDLLGDSVSRESVTMV